MAEHAETPSSKRRRLAEEIANVQAALGQVRTNLRNADRVQQRRSTAADGSCMLQTIVVLGLVFKYTAEEAMLAVVAKLLLPAVVWLAKSAEESINDIERVKSLMNAEKPRALVEQIWSNRHMPCWQKKIRRAKLLVAEYYVYREVLTMNRKGITPKPHVLKQWLRQHWPMSGDASDDFCHSVAASDRKAAKWLAKFRKLWKVAFAKLPVRGDMTPDMQSAKV